MVRCIEAFLSSCIGGQGWRDMQDEHGFTVFCYACQNGFMAGVKACLKLGGSYTINQGVPRPLWLAANMGRDNVIRALHTHAKDVNVQACICPDGTDPLTMAVLKQNTEALVALQPFYTKKKACYLGFS